MHTTDINFSQLTPAEWQSLLIQQPETICQVINLFDAGDAEPLNFLTACIKNIKIKPNEWKNIITSKLSTIGVIAATAVNGHPELLHALTSNSDNINLTSIQWKNIITTAPNTISHIAYAAVKGHTQLFHIISSQLEDIHISSDQWQHIIISCPNTIFTLVLAAENNCSTSLLENLLSHVPSMQLTPEQWKKIFTSPSATVSAILLSASCAILLSASCAILLSASYVNPCLLNAAMPRLCELDAITWQNIICKEPQVMMQLAYASSHGLITPLEAHLPTITEKLSADDWGFLLAKTDYLLLQLAIAFKKGHKGLFNAAKSCLSRMPADYWENIIYQNGEKLISVSISLARKDEPSLLNAIINYAQGLSQESLAATLRDIQDHIPKLARYAIKARSTELCQVLSQALQVLSIGLDLSDDDKQQIQTLAGNHTPPVSGNGFFAQSDHIISRMRLQTHPLN